MKFKSAFFAIATALAAAEAGAVGSVGTLVIDSSVNSGAMGTFATGAKFAMDLDATLVTSDKLSLVNGAAGDFVFNNNNIDFTTISGSLTDAQQYTLFSSDVASAYIGLTLDGSNHITAGLSIGTGLGGFGASYLSVVGNDVLLTIAAPEPSTWALLAFGLTTMVVFRRRRRG